MSIVWTPRFYQVEAVDAVLHCLATTSDDLLVAMPTGVGKSGVIAMLCEKILKQFPQARITLQTDRKELVSQDVKSLLRIWPDAPVGVYSAGLKRKEAGMPLMFCGIQSVQRTPEVLGKIHILIVDEAHMISPNAESGYQKVIAHLRKLNPKLRVIGLTATPFRRKGGYLVGAGIFTKMAYDITGVNAYNFIQDQGFLIPMLSKPVSFEYDMSQVKIAGGDYDPKQKNEAVNKDEMTEQAIRECLQVLTDRQHIMVFCSGIEHVENTKNMLLMFGENAVAVHSDMDDTQRDANIDAFATGSGNGARWIVNDGVLTTGFDSPWVDAIVLLNPTTSPVLHVQILGRGTRPYFYTHDGTSLAGVFDLNTKEGRLAAIEVSPKHNCRVMDFAGNLKRMGPINDPNVPKPRKGKKTGDMPIKICPTCGAYNHTAARFCCNEAEGCEHEFEFTTKLENTADATSAVVKRNAPECYWFVVDSVDYEPYTKPFQPATMRVKYYCGIRRFTELVSLDGQGWMRKRAKTWWTDRLGDVPTSTADGFMRTHECKVPTHIYVQVNCQYPIVVASSFDGTTPVLKAAALEQG